MTDQTQTTEQTTQETYNKEFVEKLKGEKTNYAKAVDELKLKLQTYESKFKEQEEQSLKQKEDWKTLSENAQKEAIEWKQRFEQSKAKEETIIKVGALKKEFEKMGLKDSRTIDGLKGLFNLGAIKYDETTETVIGAEEEAKRIKEILPQVFVAMSNARTNHDSVNSVPTTYTFERFNEMVKSKAPMDEIRKYQRGLAETLVKK